MLVNTKIWTMNITIDAISCNEMVEMIMNAMWPQPVHFILYLPDFPAMSSYIYGFVFGKYKYKTKQINCR